MPDSQQTSPFAAGLQMLQPLISGCAGGVGATVVGHPFDTVKARMQVGSSQAFPGIAGLFKGIGSPLAGTVPFWGCFILGYRAGQQLAPSAGLADGSSGAVAFSGVVAGTISSLVLTPVDCVKVKAQVEGSSSRTALASLWRAGGLMALYRPFLPTIGRMVPAAVVFFYSGETAKSFGCSPFVCGGVAGVTEWAAVLPIDTIKTRYTMAGPDQSLRGIIRATLRDDGMAGFYRGAMPTMLRAFPANGAAFLCIQYCDLLFENLIS
eukprot:gnl/TRDRNA2_/TRDRNA2_201927_c0_seq1.p1 gnl/TRDRNA2_/TRDRNA2_201927_c0~~gnl/TRDRNA2_/TRDRNA2_201927_c0_seq1.p1  ORF type:complete len:265 (-),score=38.35 gnl/TRDRNA2_/TRDRNA2_201927_c0_seq1:17-811(-)